MNHHDSGPEADALGDDRSRRRSESPSAYSESPKALRERLSLSQAELARLTGISVKTIRDWEQGRRRLRSRRIGVLVADATSASVLLCAEAAQASRLDIESSRLPGGYAPVIGAHLQRTSEADGEALPLGLSGGKPFGI